MYSTASKMDPHEETEIALNYFTKKYNDAGYEVCVIRCERAKNEDVPMSNPPDAYFWLLVDDAAPLFKEALHKSFPKAPEWMSSIGVKTAGGEIIVAAETNSPPMNIMGGSIGKPDVPPSPSGKKARL